MPHLGDGLSMFILQNLLFFLAMLNYQRVDYVRFVTFQELGSWQPLFARNDVHISGSMSIPPLQQEFIHRGEPKNRLPPKYHFPSITFFYLSRSNGNSLYTPFLDTPICVFLKMGDPQVTMVVRCCSVE